MAGEPNVTKHGLVRIQRTRTLYTQTNLSGWLILALRASVGPIKVRQSAIALFFSNTMAKTGPLRKTMSQHKTEEESESRFPLSTYNSPTIIIDANSLSRITNLSIQWNKTIQTATWDTLH